MNDGGDCRTALDTEFLKGSTVQPYGRATFSRDCARFCFLNAKMKNLSNFYPFLGTFFFNVLDHFVCAKILGRNCGRANKLAFRKSAPHLPPHPCCLATFKDPPLIHQKWIICRLLADPAKFRGCSTNTFAIH